MARAKKAIAGSRRPVISKRPKFTFFFGAGAEVAYGMPSGARFALQIFKHDFKPAREIFRAQRDALVASTYYDWLPDPISKRVDSFGTKEHAKAVEETLDSRRNEIVETINSFADQVAKLLEQCGTNVASFEAAFVRARGYQIGDRLYTKAIRFQGELKQTRLFDSKYFSAALDLCVGEPATTAIGGRVSAIIKLLSGALGQDLVRSLNENIFSARPDDLEVLDVGELFSVNLGEAGRGAFEIVLREQRERLDATSSLETMMSELLYAFIERVVETSISYQRLLDEYYPYLFKPRDAYAKFTRVSVFLHGVREFMEGSQANGEADFLRGKVTIMMSTLRSRRVA